MKFHYLGQLLLESNCLLLILKMFTIQDVATTITSKADCPELKYENCPTGSFHFFNSCHQLLQLLLFEALKQCAIA